MILTVEEWIRVELALDPEDDLRVVLSGAADVLLARAVAAAERGATDPLVTVSGKRAGGNSRAVTKRMLEQLGLPPRARRLVHRLLGGSPTGWPGLLRIFTEQRHLTADERALVERQLEALRGCFGGRRSPTGARAPQPPGACAGRRIGSRAG